MSKEKETETTRCNCIFGRISRFFCRAQKPDPSFALPVSLFLIRSDMLGEYLPQDLSDKISQFLLLGWRVIVKELPPQIECEGIGIHLYFEGKQLKWQERLQLQVEYVEKKTTSFQRIDLSTPLVDENLACNLFDHPYYFYKKFDDAKVVIFPNGFSLVRFRSGN